MRISFYRLTSLLLTFLMPRSGLLFTIISYLSSSEPRFGCLCVVESGAQLLLYFLLTTVVSVSVCLIYRYGSIYFSFRLFLSRFVPCAAALGCYLHSFLSLLSTVVLTPVVSVSFCPICRYFRSPFWICFLFHPCHLFDPLRDRLSTEVVHHPLVTFVSLQVSSGLLLSSDCLCIATVLHPSHIIFSRPTGLVWFRDLYFFGAIFSVFVLSLLYEIL